MFLFKDEKVVVEMSDIGDGTNRIYLRFSLVFYVLFSGEKVVLEMRVILGIG